MRIIEFDATVDNGNITIPEAFRDAVQGQMHVIIVHRDSNPRAGLQDRFLSQPLRLPDFQPLPRDEIYSSRMT